MGPTTPLELEEDLGEDDAQDAAFEVPEEEVEAAMAPLDDSNSALLVPYNIFRRGAWPAPVMCCSFCMKFAASLPHLLFFFLVQATKFFFTK